MNGKNECKNVILWFVVCGYCGVKKLSNGLCIECWDGANYFTDSSANNQEDEKMRKTVVKYWCDQCGQHLMREKEGNESSFPWEKGWVELNFLDIGTSKPTHMEEPHKIELENKDFCSKKCMLDFMNKVLGDKPDVDRRRLDLDIPQVPERVPMRGAAAAPTSRYLPAPAAVAPRRIARRPP